jgi:hypothetical protein
MQPTIARAARLIQFVGPRKNIWKGKYCELIHANLLLV